MLCDQSQTLEQELDMLGPQPLVLTIRVEGEIRGKGRPKFSRRGGFVRAYTDEKTVSAESWVRMCAVQQVGQPMLAGPLALTVQVTVGIPQSWPKKRLAQALDGSARPTGKPDADNTVKLLCDALNGVVWRDDAQIVELAFSKCYGLQPGAVLQVRAV